eukprot:10084087-Heterocapsa_arctica.AAC.1
MGQHGRIYSAHPAVVPTLRDWAIFLAKPGCEGGLGARQVWCGERGDLCRLVEAHGPLRAPSWRTTPSYSEFQTICRQAIEDYTQ